MKIKIHLALSLLLMILAAVPIKAQQALAEYRQAINSLVYEPKGIATSEKVGKSLAIFFDKRKEEAGAETAYADTRKMLETLKNADFYAAYYFLIKVKAISDAQAFLKTDFTTYEQEIIRNKLSPYTSNKIISQHNPTAYPDGVPLPGSSWGNSLTKANTPPATKPKAEVIVNTTSARDVYEKGLNALQANALDKALRLFKEAGQKGNVLAMYQAGEVSFRQQRYSDAASWYRKAAYAGLIDGMYKTGELSNGDEAIGWFKKAIEAGDTIVLEYYEGKCYQCKGTGKIVSQSKIAGTGGAIIGQSTTHTNATTISGGTTTVTTRYSSPTYETHTYTCENCKGKGTVTLKETLPSGYFQAKATLAFVTGQTEFEKGTTAYEQSYKPSDFKKAFKLYQNAAQKGHIQAMYSLGTMYRDGKGVKKDDAIALQWFRKAADAGDKSAQQELKINEKLK